MVGFRNASFGFPGSNITAPTTTTATATATAIKSKVNTDRRRGESGWV